MNEEPPQFLSGCAATVTATVLCIIISYLSMVTRRNEALLAGPLIAGFALGWHLRSIAAGCLFTLVPALIFGVVLVYMVALAGMSGGTVPPFLQELPFSYGASLMGAAALGGALRQLRGFVSYLRTPDREAKR